jgi:hypothetical protein
MVFKHWLILFLFNLSYANADALVVNSRHLTKFDGCSQEQQIKISDGWDDAVNLAITVTDRGIDFTQPMAIDFFGPPELNAGVQSQIRDVFSAVTAFDQNLGKGSSSWQVEISCVDRYNLCSKSLGGAVYTRNLDPNNLDSQPQMTYENGASGAVITFCPYGPYFGASSLQDAAETMFYLGHNDPLDELDLTWYRYTMGKYTALS